jgi:hypothetical protein
MCLGIDPGWCRWGFFPRLTTEPCVLGSTQTLKMSTRILLGVKPAGYHLLVPNVKKIRSLNLPDPHGPVQACSGTAFKQNQNVSTNFGKKSQIRNFTKIRPAVVALFLAESHDNSNSCFAHSSFISNLSDTRQVYSLFQNDSSTYCDLELPPSNESVLFCPQGYPATSYVFFLVFLSLMLRNLIRALVSNDSFVRRS